VIGPRVARLNHGKRGGDLALYTADGIVLRTRNLGEADRIITLYTREQGKVECVARGSRRARSRLVGATQLFTHGRYVVYSGRSLDTLNTADIIESFSDLREDLIKLAYASYVAELLDTSVELGEPSEDIFALVLDSFGALAVGTEPQVISRWFELRLMTLLGYAPTVDRCVSCARELTAIGEELFMSAREGGALCRQCLGRDSTAIRVRRSTVEWVKRLLATEGARLSVVRFSTEDDRLLEALGRAYVDYRVPRPLKSLGFLASIKDLA